jgi:ABC-type multidrug transport system fused ATPase/permease subunit
MSSIKEVVKISLDFATKRGLFFAFIIAVLFGSIIFILWRGAILVESGDMESGTLFSFLLYTGIIGGAIGGIGNLYANIASAIGATDRVFDILDKDSELELSETNPKQKLSGSIKFNKVNFSYPTRRDVPVLKNIDFEIKPGQKIALVGHSGNGKSTIALLLLRFYKIISGEIIIDGKNIDDYELSAYRNNIAMVPQEIMLFGGTIYENIIYGNPEATMEDVVKAAEQSNCMQFINGFPEKFDTIVGERGVKLSGGQKQRIAIARAILKDPAILILDEATSSLDAESEKLVQEALDVLMNNRTSVIIAHRLSTIKDVDQILVIDEGRIVEKGNHSDLLEHDGIYNQLASLQFES